MFEVSRVVAADFDAWVERVDVAEGISLMADYIGGRRVPVGEDPARERQAERNLYLPQPNYVAAWGGEPIDVCKIELVERGPDRHRLLWRTVRSPNGSAVHDDGTLTFERVAVPDGDPGTRVTIRGRQLFTLPPVLDAADLPSLPELHGPLLEEAYRRFFTVHVRQPRGLLRGPRVPHRATPTRPDRAPADRVGADARRRPDLPTGRRRGAPGTRHAGMRRIPTRPSTCTASVTSRGPGEGAVSSR